MCGGWRPPPERRGGHPAEAAPKRAELRVRGRGLSPRTFHHRSGVGCQGNPLLCAHDLRAMGASAGAVLALRRRSRAKGRDPPTREAVAETGRGLASVPGHPVGGAPSGQRQGIVPPGGNASAQQVATRDGHQRKWQHDREREDQRRVKHQGIHRYGDSRRMIDAKQRQDHHHERRHKYGVNRAMPDQRHCGADGRPQRSAQDDRNRLRNGRLGQQQQDGERGGKRWYQPYEGRPIERRQQ